MRKIPFKIFLTILLSCVICALFLGYLPYRKSTQAIIAGAKDELLLETRIQASELNKSLTQVEMQARHLRTLVEMTIDLEAAETNSAYMTNYLHSIEEQVQHLTTNTYIKQVYLIFNPDFTSELYQLGYVVDENQQVTPKELITAGMFYGQNDFIERYEKPVQSKQPLWSEFPTTESDNGVIHSFLVPIIVQNEVIGMIGADLELGSITTIDAYPNGYGFLFNEQFNFIFHPTFTTHDQVTTVQEGSLGGLTDLLEAEEVKVIDYTLADQRMVMGFDHLVNGNLFVLTVPEASLLSAMTSTSLYLLVCIGILLIAVIGYFASQLIARPILQLKNSLMNSDSGDLTVEFYVNSKDEVSDVGRHLNIIFGKLRGLIEKIGSVASSVNMTSKQLATAAVQSSASAEEVATSIENVALKANTQSYYMHETSSLVRNMTQEIIALGEMENQMAQSAEKTSDSAQRGQTAVEKVAGQMQQVKNTIDVMSISIEELVNRSSQIDAIVNIINKIANQTQLLALNAAIEAARAGDAGRGFAVVADEIKSLSEETVVSANQIADLIHETQTETAKARQAMEQGNEEVEEGNLVVQETASLFREIVQVASENLTMAEKNNITVKEIAELSQEILEKVESIASTAEATSENAEEVAASTEEQTATMEEVSASAETLQRMAHELEDLIHEFRY